MGLFKSLVDGVKQNLSSQITDSISDSLNNVTDDFSVESLSGKLGGKLLKGLGKSLFNKTNSQNKSTNTICSYGVKNLLLKYNGSKYSIIRDDDKDDDDDVFETGFIYDEVKSLSPYHFCMSQKGEDGKILYGIACSFAKPFFTSCQYLSVDFFDGDGLLIKDEDNDSYIIDKYGKIMVPSIYIKKLIEYLEWLNSDDEDEDQEDDE